MRHMENKTEHPSYDEYIDILFEKSNHNQTK